MLRQGDHCLSVFASCRWEGTLERGRAGASAQKCHQHVWPSGQIEQIRSCQAAGTSRKMGPSQGLQPHFLSPCTGAFMQNTNCTFTQEPVAFAGHLSLQPTPLLYPLGHPQGLFPQRCSSLTGWTAESHGHKKENCALLVS